MISPANILLQLQSFLPRLTNVFSDIVPAAGVISGSSTLLTITLSGHGLTNGASISIVNSLIDNSIISVAQGYADDGVTRTLIFETSKPHDLTLNYTNNLNQGINIELRGFTNTALNGYQLLNDVLSTTSFSIIYPTLPVLNGHEVLREQWEIGLNNVFPVTVTGLNTFTLDISSLPDYCDLPVPQISIVKNYRMAIASDYARATEIYTKQATGKYFLFVIMEDCRASKDRLINSDAMATNSLQNEQRIRLINTFTIVVFFPVTGELAGANAMNVAWTTLMTNIVKCMAGIGFEDRANDEDSNFLTTFIGHGSQAYNPAFYSHAYSFEYCFDITDFNTFTQTFIESRRFDKIDLELLSPAMGSYIDLP